MIIDSWFDNYVGVVMLVRVVDGACAKGERIKMMATGAVYNADNLGVFTPANEPRDSLGGRGGLHHCRHQGTAGGQGGRHHHAGKEAAQQRRPGHRALPGFKEIQPQVFAGLYPTEASEYDSLRDALEKLKLNDARCATSPKSARRWASASAAASSACCTWRSCRSAWSASSTRT
jgi:GTP-binding protein LepA